MASHPENIHTSMVELLPMSELFEAAAPIDVPAPALVNPSQLQGDHDRDALGSAVDCISSCQYLLGTSTITNKIK
jgi:hypothetical protein